MILALILASIIPFLPAIRGAFLLDDSAMLRCVLKKMQDVEAELRPGWLARLKWEWHHWKYDPRRVTFLTFYFTVLWEDWWNAPKLQTLATTEAEVSPIAFHVGNAVVHALAVIAFYSLISHWTSQAGLAALVFAIHPLQVTSVAYIQGRAGMLSALFMLLALNAMFTVGAWTLAAAIGAAVLANKSKEDAVVLPVLALGLWAVLT